jgi:hypothetical protein
MGTHRLVFRTPDGPCMTLRIFPSIHRLRRYGSNAILALSSLVLMISETLMAAHSSAGMSESRGYTSCTS